MKRPIVVTHHEMTLGVKPSGKKHPVTPITRLTILDIFKHFKNRGYETKDRKFKDNRFCGLLPIIQISGSNDRIDLVLCLSDKDADNQIVRDFENIQNTRPLTRAETEGVDSVVHVVIKFDSNSPTHAQFAIERKSGLTPAIFIDTLNYFLKDISKGYPEDFKGVHPTDKDEQGNPKKLPLVLKFHYESVLSDEIIDAFEKGRVQDVLFHEPLPKSSSFDPAGNFVPNKKTVHLDVKGSMINARSKNTLEKMRDLSNGFKGMIKGHKDLKGTTFTIKFKTQDGQNQTAYYHASEDEFSLAKKTYVSESVRNPASETLELNQLLCDKIYSSIK